MGFDPFVQTNNESATAYVGENANSGAIFLYGLRNTNDWHDLSVSHFKFQKSASELSIHQFSTVYDKGVAMSDSLEVEQTYTISAGKSYGFEFTYENNGVADLANIDVAFYLSANNKGLS